MEVAKLIASMECFANTLPVMLQGTSNEDAAWKPPNGNWSILEIVCHLIDEEIEDFHIRLKLTLEQPGVPWPEWDPEGCAVSRKYNDRNLALIIEEFVKKRGESVIWLKQLSDVDWNTSYHHPNFGSLSAGNLLASWVAHDQLHVRQIAKRKFEMIVRDSSPYDIAYAGGWE